MQLSSGSVPKMARHGQIPGPRTFKPLPALARVRELFSYDADTGILQWSVANSNAIRVGQVVKYAQVQIDGEPYHTHRIVWLWQTGVEPNGQIDHRDLNRKNNRWENLRLATDSQNQANKRARSKSGLKGVVKNRTSFYARAVKDGVSYYLGSFATAGEAHAAYCAKAKELHGDFARAA